MLPSIIAFITTKAHFTYYYYTYYVFELSHCTVKVRKMVIRVE